MMYSDFAQAIRRSSSVLGRSPLRWSLSSQILGGLLLGIATGLFFGEECARLNVIGEAFIGLLRMTVLPYIVVSLIANFGRLSLSESRRLAIVGGGVLLGLWTLGLVIVFAMSQAFPDWKSNAFFSTAITETSPAPDLVAMFVPSNIFTSLVENQVAAVVVAGILIGVGLSQVEQRAPLITILDVLAKALIRVSGMIAHLAPIGIFAISASAAGTMVLDDLPRLKAYLLSFTTGGLILSFFLLPWLVSLSTPFSYRNILKTALGPMIAAFATGKLIIVLPMLIEATEEMFARLENNGHGVAPTVDVLYPLAYPFPHVGKLLGMIFIPFSAWFLGKAMVWSEYPVFLVSGLFAYFGGPILATPYLLDQMHLPHDMFQLFIISGVYAERVSDATGAMHLLVLSVMATCALTGRFRLSVFSIGKIVLVTTLLVSLTAWGLRAVLAKSVVAAEDRAAIITRMQLIEHSVDSTILPHAVPNPMPLRPNESLLARTRRRGIIRIGFNEDKLPFAYFNNSADLVGFDINMAYALASDLGVKIEFVPFKRDTLAQQLIDDDFDVVMSGLVGTLEHAEAMSHTSAYLEVRLALVVRDYRARSFHSLSSIRRMSNLRIGFVDLSHAFVERLREDLPDAELVELPRNRAFFENSKLNVDALLISAESGAAFTLLYPEYEVVVPQEVNVSLPLFYAVGARDSEMRDFLEHWIDLCKRDGTVQKYYDHWIRGKNAEVSKPRWCLARDVLGWID